MKEMLMVEILSVFVLCFTAIAATQDNDAMATMKDEIIANKDLIISNLQQENANLHIDNGNLHIEIGNLQKDDANLHIEIGNLHIDNGNLHIEIGNLHIDNGNLHIEIGNLQKDDANLQKDNANLHIEIGNLQKMNQYLRMENSNCTIELEEDDESSCNETFSLFVTQSKKNFADTQQECIAGGGELINWKLWGFGTVGTEYFSEIRQLFDQYNYLYIGLSDREVDGDWKWIDETAYQPDLDVDQVYKWHSGNPRNDDGDTVFNTDCGFINNGELWDGYCTANHYGLCQKQLTSCP